jgi:hypothetical protein
VNDPRSFDPLEYFDEYFLYENGCEQVISRNDRLSVIDENDDEF